MRADIHDGPEHNPLQAEAGYIEIASRLINGGSGVLTALLLICSAAVAADPGDCTRSNANTVVRVPAEFGNPATCFMHAQAYLAGSSIGRELDANEQVRIVCVKSESIIASAKYPH